MSTELDPATKVELVLTTNQREESVLQQDPLGFGSSRWLHGAKDRKLQ